MTRAVEYGDLLLTDVLPATVGAPVESGWVINGAWQLYVVGRTHQACRSRLPAGHPDQEVVNEWQQDVPELRHDRIVEPEPLPEGYDDEICF
ncbi:hypothetical protein RCIP0075_00025 [Klebsiella phage RCIP0075]